MCAIHKIPAAPQQLFCLFANTSLIAEPNMSSQQVGDCGKEKTHCEPVVRHRVLLLSSLCCFRSSLGGTDDNTLV